MIVTIGSEDGRRLVTLTEVPRAYTHHLVRGLEFTRDGGTFTWEYPTAAPCWEDAARNWERDGAEMLDQALGVRPPDWEADLAWIAPSSMGRARTGSSSAAPPWPPAAWTCRPGTSTSPWTRRRWTG